MKKFLSMVLSVVLFIGIAACGGDANSSTPPTDPPAGPPDLSGQWKQVNSESEGSYQGAIINGDKMEIYWVSNNGDTRSLYWAGSFDAPSTGEEPHSWDSRNNMEKTSSSMLASGDSTKTFTYEDGQITYSASMMGSTTKVRLEKMEWEPGLKITDDVPIPSEEVLPSEKIQDGLPDSADSFSFPVAGFEFLIPSNFEKVSNDSSDNSSTTTFGAFWDAYQSRAALVFLEIDVSGVSRVSQQEFDAGKEALIMSSLGEDTHILTSKEIFIAGLPAQFFKYTAGDSTLPVYGALVYNMDEAKILLVLLSIKDIDSPDGEYTDYFLDLISNTKIVG